MEKQPTLSVITSVTQVVIFFEVCQTKCTLLEMYTCRLFSFLSWYTKVIKAVMIKKNYGTFFENWQILIF